MTFKEFCECEKVIEAARERILNGGEALEVLKAVRLEVIRQRKETEEDEQLAWESSKQGQEFAQKLGV